MSTHTPTASTRAPVCSLPAGGSQADTSEPSTAPRADGVSGASAQNQTQPSAEQIAGGGRLPRHIAAIMDGNGRWAQKRGQPRIFGHEAGAQVVRPIVTECARLGIEALTLYSFSMDNWKRPTAEVEFLMGLYEQYLRLESPTMIENNIRFRHVGRTQGLPPRVLDMMQRTAEATAHNTGLTLCLALNYGARAEIVDAVRALADEVARGELDPQSIGEADIADRLYTAGLPDPDLLIRTAGEHRLSNYLLWQISYAEIYVCDDCWPDFSVEHLHAALRDFAGRQRKFGALTDSHGSSQV